MTVLGVHRGMPLRRIAIGLLGLGCAVILGAAWMDYAWLPTPRGTTPYTALGLGWSLRDLALFAGMWSFFGLIFGGWKVVLIAVGRPPQRPAVTLIWFGLFAVYCACLTTETLHQFGLHLWY